MIQTLLGKGEVDLRVTRGKQKQKTKKKCRGTLSNVVVLDAKNMERHNTCIQKVTAS